MAHTKGKWEVRKLGKQGECVEIVHIEPDGQNRICRMIEWAEKYQAEQEANAHLIAAAPALLEACKDIVEAFDVKMGAKAIKLRVELCRDAIAAAEGK